MVRWILKDSKGNIIDSLIKSCPLLNSIDEIYAKIRNTKYQYIKKGTLFPEEVQRYEPFIIREALNNCIAHQDYMKSGMINIVEKEDQLLFTNLGEFIPGSIENVIIEDAPEEYYRNRLLATAMFKLNMVETEGGGIRKMFNYQSKRFFPMPEYDISKSRVSVTVVGKVLDINYATVLAQNDDLTLEEIIMLDKIQKGKQLTNTEVKHLKQKNLIEGRKPNYHISFTVAQTTGQKAEYSKYKAFNKKYYLDFIIEAINTHKSLERMDIDKLLWDKLPDNLTEKQKKTKINNLLSELRQKGIIVNEGSAKKSKWVLINSENN